MYTTLAGSVANDIVDVLFIVSEVKKTLTPNRIPENESNADRMARHEREHREWIQKQI